MLTGPPHVSIHKTVCNTQSSANHTAGGLLFCKVEHEDVHNAEPLHFRGPYCRIFVELHMCTSRPRHLAYADAAVAVSCG